MLHKMQSNEELNFDNEDHQSLSVVKEFASSSSSSSSSSNEIISDDSNFKFKETNFSNQFFASLNQFRDDELFCDISIKIENKILHAHKVIISTIPFFYHLFSSNMMENQTNIVEIKENISYSIFQKMIDYAYSGEIIINLDNVQEICIASSFLCIKSILNASINYIIRHLNHSNVLEYKSFSKFFPVLESHIEEFINEEFIHIYQTDEFLNLNYDEIKQIISNNDLNVDEEKIVYEAMMRWIKADEINRKQYLCTLLEQIRLPFISCEYIVDNIITENLIKKCLKCRDLIDEAKDYHLLPQRRNLIQNHRIVKRSFSKENPIIAIGIMENKKIYFEIYDSTRDQWKLYLTENRQLKLRTSITVLKNQVVFIGGYLDTVRTNNVDVFNLSEKKWSQIASLNKKRSALASVTLDDKIYSCGGYDGKNTLQCCEVYSPKSNRWTYIADMNKFRCSSAAVTVNNSIYIIGGHNGVTIFKSIERYDPFNNEWILCKDMKKERCRLGATSLNNKIYVAGGFSGISDENSFECYDPCTDEWTELKPMLKCRYRFSLIANGRKIYAIGGYTQDNFTNCCEVYDVEKDTWSFVSNMDARQNNVGVILMTNSFKY